MIVLLTEGDERSPLKTTPPQLPSQFQAPAPPPYSPPANAHGQGLLGRPTPTFCQSLHRDIHSHDQPSGSVSQRTSRRFIRAFLVAVMVIILWGMFIDSVDIAARVDRSKINLGDYHGYSVKNFFRSFLGSSPRRAPTVSTPSPCAPSLVPGGETRPLPIQYPPYVVIEPSSVPP